MLFLLMAMAGTKMRIISPNIVASSNFSSNRRVSRGSYCGFPSSLSIKRPSSSFDEHKQSLVLVLQRSPTSHIVRSSSSPDINNGSASVDVEATSPSLEYPYPLLLVNPRYNKTLGKNKRVFCFYNVEKHDLYVTSNLIPKEISRSVCCGSTPHGWLVYISYVDCSMYLWNPSSPSSVQSLYKLPPIITLYHIVNSIPQNPDSGTSTKAFEFRLWEDQGGKFSNEAHDLSLELMEKVVLSGAPVNDDCIAVALNGMGYKNLDEGILHVSYCKPGGRKWITIKSLSYQPFRDIVHLKDKLFYILHESGHVFSLDLHDFSSPKITVIEASLPKKEWSTDQYTRPQFYLVASQGDLFCIIRYCDYGYFDAEQKFVTGMNPGHGRYTLELEVYKFDFLKSEWKRATDIRDQVFFLGVNQSFALSSYGFSMFKKNHIFFTDDYMKLSDRVRLLLGGYDIGYYNMEDGTISRYTTEACVIVPNIIWVMPNP